MITQRTPLKGTPALRFASARYETISQAGQRHRARSAAYHNQRRAAAARDVVMAPIVSIRPSQASTSRTEVKTFDCHVTVPAANLPLVTGAAGGEPTAAFVGITELNDIRQGAGFNNRIGAKVVIKSVELTAEVFSPTSTAQGPLR